MSDERDELATWAEDFRGEDGPAMSMEVVVEQAARDARRERHQWAQQIVGNLFAVAVFIGLVVRTRSWLQAALAAIVLPTLIALFGYFVYVRMELRASEAKSVRDFVTLAVRRRRADLRLLRAGVAAQALLTLAFWAWWPFYVLSKAERFGAQPWRLAVGALASLVIFGVSFFVLGKRVARARQELERSEKTLSALDGDADRAP